MMPTCINNSDSPSAPQLNRLTGSSAQQIAIAILTLESITQWFLSLGQSEIWGPSAGRFFIGAVGPPLNSACF
jgi:hypothetical protein